MYKLLLTPTGISQTPCWMQQQKCAQAAQCNKIHLLEQCFFCCLQRAEPARRISKLSACLGPPWPPEGPQECMKRNCFEIFFFVIYIILHVCQCWQIPKINLGPPPPPHHHRGSGGPQIKFCLGPHKGLVRLWPRATRCNNFLHLLHRTWLQLKIFLVSILIPPVSRLHATMHKSSGSLLKQQHLPESGILLMTIRAYCHWSKRRVVTSSSFQN